jgi:hypothetical protein
MLYIVVHVCNPSSWEAEVGASQVQGQPGFHSKLKASLDYKSRPCLKNMIKTKKKKI